MKPPSPFTATLAVRLIGCATPLPVRDSFFDPLTGALIIGVDLPPGFGRTEDETQQPYVPDAAARAAKIDGGEFDGETAPPIGVLQVPDEPLAVIGQTNGRKEILP